MKNIEKDSIIIVKFRILQILFLEGLNEGKNENSLLVGFVEDEDFPIAFCILVEDKNNTSVKTEYIAKVILDSLSNTYEN